MASPTTQQLLTAVAALARGFTLPSVNNNQMNISRGPGNTLRVPIYANDAHGAYNNQLGQNVQISISPDGHYVEIQLNVGDVASGL